MSAPRTGMGHNQGPTMQGGHAFRRFQWQKARAEAMPKAMPLMVVRMHVARARALGLDYPTYAAVRKASGRDIMGLLFSDNALGIVRAGTPMMPVARSERLAAVEGARKLALVHAPLRPDAVVQANPVLDAAARAPVLRDSWADMRAHLGRVIIGEKLSRDQVLIIGETSLEQDWTTAAKAAGYLAASRYFEIPQAG